MFVTTKHRSALATLSTTTTTPFPIASSPFMSVGPTTMATAITSNNSLPVASGSQPGITTTLLTSNNPVAIPQAQSPKTANSISASLPITVGSSHSSNAARLQANATANGLGNSQSGRQFRRSPRKPKAELIDDFYLESPSPTPPPTTRNANRSPTKGKAVAAVPPRSPHAFDMSTVKMPSAQRLSPRAYPRPFNLPDCPVLYPTAEEFKDPMAYMRSIVHLSEKTGIIKIVPPSDWKMPFVTNPETFRFNTRLQRLNSIEATSRSKLNFLEALSRFHKQLGNPRVMVPTVNGKPLDLWSLRKEVRRLGGYEAVNNGPKWSEIGPQLGFKELDGLPTQLKNTYIRVILPYELFLEKVRSAQPKQPVVVEEPIDLTRDGSPMSISDASPTPPPPEVHETKNLNGVVIEPSSARGSMRTKMANVAPSKVAVSTQSNGHVKDLNGAGSGAKKKNLCEVCQKMRRGVELIECDGCDSHFHASCLNPPLPSSPHGKSWYCHNCLFGAGVDFGFDEGDEHSLASFQTRAETFRNMWFEEHPPPKAYTNDANDPTVVKVGKLKVSEDDVEEEFWRLVQSQEETIEVEYGADVHSATHGSAMPTLETHPLDPYSKDPWNLNNLPIASESLLRYIKTDISGMTVPWTYIGMIFSTFCWHNEDHYTYSVNYMHWGDTKTWYGIPGADAEKFETAMRKEAPELFEAQPDLLFQLVTLMNPGRLVEAGVRVHACNQRAGEFVITFPKAYHAGFNHGFNFNEAANFALPDWLPYGQACVQYYRANKKSPIFSHDELLVTIALQSTSIIRTAVWLAKSYTEMVQTEKAGRDRLRDEGIQESVEEADVPEEEQQCFHCKAFCFLSQVTCSCTKEPGVIVACLEHAALLCRCSMTNRILRMRHSDSFLQYWLDALNSRAGAPDMWRQRFRETLSKSATPELRELQSIVKQGTEMDYPLEGLSGLKEYVDRANHLIDACIAATNTKPDGKKNRRPRPDGLEETAPVAKRKLRDLQQLLRDIESLSFDAPEVEALKKLISEAAVLKNRALTLLDSRPKTSSLEAFLKDCKTLLADGESVNVEVEEISKLKEMMSKEYMMQDLQGMGKNVMNLDNIRELIERALACGLPDDDEYMMSLKSRLQVGVEWEDRAHKVLIQPKKTIQELDDLLDIESNIPVDISLLSRVSDALVRATRYDRKAKAWQEKLKPNTTLPTISDVVEIIHRAESEFTISSISDLKVRIKYAQDLEERCHNISSNQHNHRDEDQGNVFTEFKKWQTYVEEHLKNLTLPKYKALLEQMDKHDRWLQMLPWVAYDDEPAADKVLRDVTLSTKPEDDTAPADEYVTCICFEPVRPPPPGEVSDAVECDHCRARFHGPCAAKDGSCPFCDPNHWNRTTHRDRNYHIHFLATMLATAPAITKTYSKAWKQLEEIVQKTDRLSRLTDHFLSFLSDPRNQRPEYMPQVRHYMRKLYKIQFAVSCNPEESFGLDLAILHFVLADRVKLRKKNGKKPKFIFGQDVDKDWVDGTRCICRGCIPYLSTFPTVACRRCARLYHMACVFYNASSSDVPVAAATFTCPLCLARKGLPYPEAEVRVRHINDCYWNPAMCIDVKKCVETYSQELIRVTLPRPVNKTLFVDLYQFIPGRPGDDYPFVSDATMKASPRKRESASAAVKLEQPASSISTRTSIRPPPPPWTRTTASTNAVPLPSTSISNVTASVPASKGTDTSLGVSANGRKRKNIELHMPRSRPIADAKPSAPPTRSAPSIPAAKPAVANSDAPAKAASASMRSPAVIDLSGQESPTVSSPRESVAITASVSTPSAAQQPPVQSPSVQPAVIQPNTSSTVSKQSPRHRPKVIDLSGPDRAPSPIVKPTTIPAAPAVWYRFDNLPVAGTSTSSAQSQTSKEVKKKTSVPAKRHYHTEYAQQRQSTNDAHSQAQAQAQAQIPPASGPAPKMKAEHHYQHPYALGMPMTRSPLMFPTSRWPTPPGLQNISRTMQSRDSGAPGVTNGGNGAANASMKVEGANQPMAIGSLPLKDTTENGTRAPPPVRTPIVVPNVQHSATMASLSTLRMPMSNEWATTPLAWPNLGFDPSPFAPLSLSPIPGLNASRMNGNGFQAVNVGSANATHGGVFANMDMAPAGATGNNGAMMLPAPSPMPTPIAIPYAVNPASLPSLPGMLQNMPLANEWGSSAYISSYDPSPFSQSMSPIPGLTMTMNSMPPTGHTM